MLLEQRRLEDQIAAATEKGDDERSAELTRAGALWSSRSSRPERAA